MPQSQNHSNNLFVKFLAFVVLIAAAGIAASAYFSNSGTSSDTEISNDTESSTGHWVSKCRWVTEVETNNGTGNNVSDNLGNTTTRTYKKCSDVWVED